MNIEHTLPLLEQILAPWRNTIGAQFDGYKNHCYRMIHFCLALHPNYSEDDKTKIIVAAAHHDVGLWSAGTVDYIPPSEREARLYCQANGLQAWEEEIALLVSEHHKLKAYTDVRYPLVEVFRKGDLVDFSLGVVKHGLPRSTVKSVKAAFPNVGFHKFLMQGAWQWFSKHPLSMPPFMKW
ncbi:MAG: HD domain-containing protein [Formosimonas sp.]